jgi:hypothetical protein
VRMESPAGEKRTENTNRRRGSSEGYCRNKSFAILAKSRFFFSGEDD